MVSDEIKAQVPPPTYYLLDSADGKKESVLKCDKEKEPRLHTVLDIVPINASTFAPELSLGKSLLFCTTCGHLSLKK